MVLLFTANIINIGADLGAMADALGLIIGGPHLLYVVFFGTLCVVLQIFLQYTRYVSVLKWLTLSLFAYFGTVMVVEVPWGQVARGLFIPSLTWDVQFWSTVVAIFGTTISLYLFFWQASQEVEDQHANPRREPLVKAPEQATGAIERIRHDTYAPTSLPSRSSSRQPPSCTRMASRRSNRRAKRPRRYDRWRGASPSRSSPSE